MERLSPAILSMVILLVIVISWTTGEPQYQFPHPVSFLTESARGKPIGIYERSGGGSIFAASVNNTKVGLYGKQGAVSVNSPYAPIYGRLPILRSGKQSVYLKSSAYGPLPPVRGPLITRWTQLPVEMLPPRRKATFSPLPPKYFIPVASARYSRVQSGK